MKVVGTVDRGLGNEWWDVDITYGSGTRVIVKLSMAGTTQLIGLSKQGLTDLIGILQSAEEEVQQEDAMKRRMKKG